MTADTTHTCSYSCERPGCIRAQRDELAARLTALAAEGAQAEPKAEAQLTYKGVPIGPMQTFADIERQAIAPVGVEVTWPLSILEAGNWREVYMGTKHMRLEVSYPYETWERLMAALAVAQQQLAEDGSHCATCTCNPNMTPAVRFDLSPAQQEGAIREHLIRLGWTPPDKHAQQSAAVDKVRFRKAPCYLCGYNGPGYFQSETHPCAALYHAAQHQEPPHDHRD
jgi:hypothetical protein